MAVLYFFEKRERGRDPRQVWQNVRICSTRVIAITRALAILFSPLLNHNLYLEYPVSNQTITLFTTYKEFMRVFLYSIGMIVNQKVVSDI